MNRFLLLLLVFSVSFFSQSFAQEKIRWEEGKNLSWKEFRAKAVKSSPMAAETYTRSEFSMSYQDGQFQWEVDCYFSPKNSWVKSDLKSVELLSHEQLHFDIAELNARKIRKKLDELELKSIDDSKKLQKAYKEGLDELAKTQREYDKATDHGIISKAQKQWEYQIRSEMDKYKSYASSNYTFSK